MSEKDKAQKPKEIRTFVKVEKDKYKLTVDNTQVDSTYTKIFSKKESMDVYDTLKAQRGANMSQKGQIERKISTLDVKDTPELRQFIANMSAAKSLAQKTQFEDQLKLIKSQIEGSTEKMQEIEKVMPENFRGKKKT